MNDFLWNLRNIWTSLGNGEDVGNIVENTANTVVYWGRAQKLIKLESTWEDGKFYLLDIKFVIYKMPFYCSLFDWIFIE